MEGATETETELLEEEEDVTEDEEGLAGEEEEEEEGHEGYEDEGHDRDDGGGGSEATLSQDTEDDADAKIGGDVSSRPDGGSVDYGDFLQQQYNELVAKLQSYKESHGDCNVPRDWAENPKLGAWVHEQRERHRKGNLPKDRFEELTRLGFVWESPNDIIWREKYERLVAYKESYGDCVVPGNYAADPSLAVWVKYQRDAKRKGRLSDRQISLLEELGFQWELTLEKQWNDKFDKLKVYQQTYGDCNVPYNFSEDPNLGMWVKYQRDAKRRGRINKKYFDLLEGLGFQWEPALDKQWNDRFEKLVAFKREHGHTSVPNTFKDQALVTWIGYQRDWYKNGKLSAERVKILKGLGFEFEQVVRPWQEMYKRLLSFRLKHGDCNVPLNWPQDPELAAWVSDQRGNYRKGRLAPEHKHDLDKIDFKWSVPAKKKKDQQSVSPGPTAPVKQDPGTEDGAGGTGDSAGGAHLSDAGGEHGDHEASTSAARKQQQVDEYEDFLNAQWNKQFSKLEEYKAAHGDCEVPRDYPEDPSLCGWVNEQRERFKKGQLPEDRVQKLARLAFQWRTQADISWDEQFEKLVAYRVRYNDCHVPNTYAEDQKLSNWVSYQKERIRKGKMQPDRLERLKSIGFEWETLLERQWNEKYEKLVAFRDIHGHCELPSPYPEDPQLRQWVKQQRSRKRNGKLNPAFIQRLNSIGFVWQLQGGEAADKDREREGDASTASAGNHLANGGGDTGRAKAQPKGEDSDCVTQSAGSHKQPPDSEEQGDMDAERVHAMVKSLKRTADALSSIAGQVNSMKSKRQKLSGKLSSLQSAYAAAEQDKKASAQKIASHESTIRALERRLEVMTSALERAEKQIEATQRDAAAARGERAALLAQGMGSASRAASAGRGLLCRGCGERPPSCVVMPCMHFLYCRMCLDSLQARSKVCPGCETPCLSIMDVQLSL